MAHTKTETHFNQSSLSLFLKDFSAPSDVDEAVVNAAAALNEAIWSKSKQSEYFLTVLVRTQGKREEALKDALLCLASQTDSDFHVVILAHDAKGKNAAMLERIVARQEPSFRDRINIVPVKGGSRAKPLNVGIGHIRGNYVSVFDDDDLLFANWVEVFKEGANASPGTVQRAISAAQHVKPETWPQGGDGYRTVTWPEVPYPETFEILDHFEVNKSPFMSIAFPAIIFTKLGLRFDEELSVCEDWDLILQAALLCGVNSLKELTSIYRMWDGVETSYTKHSEDSWRASEAKVKARVNDKVQLIPIDTVDRIREFLSAKDAIENYGILFKNSKLRKPFVYMIKILSPGVRFSVRVRNKLWNN
jgi:glycosyltransferase involved in cell wall biosynthesis